MYEAERSRFYSTLKKVDILIVGESRPNNGTFFYFRNSVLYKYINEEIARYTNSYVQDFDCLEFFKSNNIFLDDLNQEPVNHLPRDIRRMLNRNAIQSLSDRIKKYQPRIVISILKGVREEVCKAISLSSFCPDKVYFISFPANGQQNNFRKEFLITLQELFSDNDK